jgi:hypothetical protein
MRNIRWIAIVAALVFAAVVGGIAYNAGVAHGLEQSGKIVVAAPGAVPAAPYPYAYYGWHRPWGFGFFFAPFFFIAFWFLIARVLFFGGRGWHHRRGHCGYRDERATDGAPAQ